MDLVNIALEIQKIIMGVKDGKRRPEHLVGNPLILFQRFKESYETRNFQNMADTLSEEFSGEMRYGATKSQFIATLRYNLERLPLGVAPSLTIRIHTICPESHDHFFSGLIDMSVNLEVARVMPIGRFDSGRFHCEARPEGTYGIWRISKLRAC